MEVKEREKYIWRETDWNKKSVYMQRERERKYIWGERSIFVVRNRWKERGNEKYLCVETDGMREREVYIEKDRWE